MIFGKDEQIRVRIFWVHDNYSIKFFANRFHTSTSLEVFTKIFNEITMLQNLFLRVTCKNIQLTKVHQASHS